MNISELIWQFLCTDDAKRCMEILSEWTGVQHITIRYHRHKTRHFLNTGQIPNGALVNPGTALGLGLLADSALPGVSVLGDVYSMKVHYCGTDTQIFRMQRVLRNENLQRAILERDQGLLRQK